MGQWTRWRINYIHNYILNSYPLSRTIANFWILQKRVFGDNLQCTHLPFWFCWVSGICCNESTYISDKLISLASIQILWHESHLNMNWKLQIIFKVWLEIKWQKFPVRYNILQTSFINYFLAVALPSTGKNTNLVRNFKELSLSKFDIFLSRSPSSCWRCRRETWSLKHNNKRCLININIYTGMCLLSKVYIRFWIGK